jgi:hypothetical protein
MELMNIVMKGFEEFTSFYLDDIIIFSKSPEEHLHHLKLVLDRLREHELYCQKDKCAFLLEKVDFLGHVITSTGLAMDDRKVAAVKEWPAPLNVRDVKGFLGLVGYYRKFVKGFSEIARPLTELTGKDAEFIWTQVEQKAFEEIRDAICLAPILQIPNPHLPFVIESDASGFATGAVLLQDQGKGLLPCAYASKKFSPAETRWSVHEQEAFGVIRALKEWRAYVHGADTPVKIYTDHKSLIFLQTQPILSSKQTRWMIELADYNYEILYKPGRENVVADALSRNPDLMWTGVSGEMTSE